MLFFSPKLFWKKELNFCIYQSEEQAKTTLKTI